VSVVCVTHGCFLSNVLLISFPDVQHYVTAGDLPLFAFVAPLSKFHINGVT